MSIADKLTTIAENEQRVYDAGYAKGAEENSGGGADLARSIVDRSIVEYSDEEITTIGKSAFRNCDKLKSINLPNVARVEEYGFYYCTALEAVDLPNVKSIGNYALSNCFRATYFNLPLLENVSSNGLRDNNKITMFDLPRVGAIYSNGFYCCFNLNTLILRKSDAICTLGGTSAFSSTSISSSEGYIYVPSALVSTYKSATNWSTYATRFRALEDYTVDGTITGELDESKI